MPSLPAALSDASFTIAGGLQVGIIGRTGAAGKSSILNALFRLEQICNGCILVDGTNNVANLSVRDLCRSFAVVPQNPFLFEGTLSCTNCFQDNLDPFQQFDDSNVWSSLEKCHIKQEIQTAGGLDAHVKDSGTSFLKPSKDEQGNPQVLQQDETPDFQALLKHR